MPTVGNPSHAMLVANKSESLQWGPGLECPACQSRLSWTEVSVDLPFRCPTCDTEVTVPDWYKRGLTWSAMAIAGLMAYQFGLRDLVFCCSSGSPLFQSALFSQVCLDGSGLSGSG